MKNVLLTAYREFLEKCGVVIMKISSVSTVQLKVPLNKPMRTRHVNLEYAYCLLIKIKTDNGITGEGLVRSTNQSAMNFINTFVTDFFTPLLIEQSFDSPEKAWNTVWLTNRNHLQSSYGLYALAGIDIALWDIYGKEKNTSLHALLNINTDFVVPYGNGGWLRDLEKEITNDIEWYLSRGCKHFKMRIGCDNDIERIKWIRSAFGDEVILLADANQYYDFDSAVKMSKILADFGIFWFEEPLFSCSVSELSELARLSPVPIATGENMNSHWQIEDACKLNAAKIFQPDVIYQGGITELIKTAKIIEFSNLTMGTHLFHELSASLAGLCKNHYVEHIDFFPDNFFVNDFSIKEGKIFLPKIAGNGVNVSEYALKTFVIK